MDESNVNPASAKNGTASIVLAHEEYDSFSAEGLRRELSMLSGNDCTIDFRHVRYIDSTCLSELIRTFKRLRTEDAAAQMHVVNLQGSVRHIFQITGLNTLFA